MPDTGILLKWDGVDSWIKVAEQYSTRKIITSLCVVGGEIYATAHTWNLSDGSLLKWNGTDSWISVYDWVGDYPMSIIDFGGVLYGITYNSCDLFKLVSDVYTPVVIWSEVDYAYSELAIFDNKLYVNTDDRRLLEFNGTNAWIQRVTSEASTVLRSFITFNGGFYGSAPGTGKLFEINTSSWTISEVAPQFVHINPNVTVAGTNNVNYENALFGLGISYVNDRQLLLRWNGSNAWELFDEQILWGHDGAVCVDGAAIYASVNGSLVRYVADHPSESSSTSPSISESASGSSSESSSVSPSRSQSASESKSGSASTSPSRSQSASASRSGSASTSPSRSQSASASRSESSSVSPSRSQSASESKSGSASTSPSRSQSASASRSGSASTSPSRSQSASASRSESSSVSPSRSQSASESKSGSSSISPSRSESSSISPSSSHSPSISESASDSSSDSASTSPSISESASVPIIDTDVRVYDVESEIRIYNVESEIRVYNVEGKNVF